MEIKKMTCILCPLGCRMEVSIEKNKIIRIEGNSCPRGEMYARQEVEAPSRIVISVVKCRDCNLPVISVKTEKPVPKERIREVIDSLAEVEVEPPVNVGDIIVEDVAGTGVNVIATRRAWKKNSHS
ncbi:MAG: molybdopterin oxidoreductase [Thermoplasmata archaeon]|nr:MAG: molybdopterin oxidoreductase [Thermoplasmata archaeon]